MRRTLVLISCLASAGHAYRRRPTIVDAQSLFVRAGIAASSDQWSGDNAVQRLSKTLATLIARVASPDGAFRPTSLPHGTRALSRSLEDSSQRSPATRMDLEASLLSLLSSTDGRGAALTAADNAEVHRLATAIVAGEANKPLATVLDKEDTNDSKLLPGRWRVLYQGIPGAEKTEFLSPESWRKYIAGEGPSPIQNLVSGSGSVSRLYQITQLSDDRKSGRILNVVDASPAAVVAIEAQLENSLTKPNRLGFRFSGGKILLRTLWNGTLDLPYPVPFDLLGDNAKGWLQTDYITPTLRLSRGNKGSLFVLVPEPEPNDGELEAFLDEDPAPPPSPSSASLTKDPVIVCPAQFGTRDDYEELVEALQARGHPVVVAPLKPTDWLRLIPASVTPEYWKGELSPDVALPFYYEALDKAADELSKQYPERKIQLVAHSIGGWITRAYLGKVSASQRAKFSALVTLGTPHRPPPDGFFKKIDQTRGLLKFVEERYPGAHFDELRYMTVGSRAQAGALPWGDANDGEPSPGLLAGTLAAASYLPLCGDAFTVGDGITPLACAHLDGAEQRVVDCFHIAYVPGARARLRGTPWYGSPEILEQWADFLQ